MTPSGSHYHEIERLRDKYGYMDTKSKKYKVLNNVNVNIKCHKNFKVKMSQFLKYK